MNLKINLSKKSPLTEEIFFQRGYIQYKSISSSCTIFSKNNFYFTFYKSVEEFPIPRVKISPVDPSLINWTNAPEQVRGYFKCPTEETLEFIEHLFFE